MMQEVGKTDEYRELRLEEMHRFVCDRVSSALGNEFENVGPLKWVKRDDGPFRAIYSWQKAPLQGLIPRWGWSIDFVPHVGRKRIGWHKSLGAARMDYGNWNNVGPFKYKGISWISDQRTFEERCLRSAEFEHSVHNAKSFWESYVDIDGVFKFVAEFRNRGWLLPLIGHPLPEAFCLARIGQESLAHKRLDEEHFELLRFHNPFDRDRILRELHEALDRPPAN